MTKVETVKGINWIKYTILILWRFFHCALDYIKTVSDITNEKSIEKSKITWSSNMHHDH